jgi:hypothetical protein
MLVRLPVLAGHAEICPSWQHAKDTASRRETLGSVICLSRLDMFKTGPLLSACASEPIESAPPKRGTRCKDVIEDGRAERARLLMGRRYQRRSRPKIIRGTEYPHVISTAKIKNIGHLPILDN